jgi:parvulin-like peptidyl-prolyl isomerase
MSRVWLCAALCALWAQPVLADTVDQIIAVVNDEAITGGDLAIQIQRWREDQAQTAAGGTAGGDGVPATQGEAAEPPQEVVQQALQRLIEKRLILQEARRAGIAISGDEIAERLQTLRNRFPSEEAFRASLAESGVTREQLKEQIREQLMVERIINDKVRSTIVVSPQEVAQAMKERPELTETGERAWARHLLVRVNDQRSAERAKALADELYAKILAGQDFAELAKKHSEDPRAAEGGALGWVAEGDLLPELDRLVFSLKPGETAPPVQTRLGYHIVRVEERRSAESLSLSEANGAVYDALFQQKFEEAFRRWLGQVADHAYIHIAGQS